MISKADTANIDTFDVEIAGIYGEIWRVELERDALDEGDRRDQLDVQSRNLRERARSLDEKLNSLLEANLTRSTVAA